MKGLEGMTSEEIDRINLDENLVHDYYPAPLPCREGLFGFVGNKLKEWYQIVSDWKFYYTGF